MSVNLPADAVGVMAEHDRHAAIEKAKREWEVTVDALTALVCLLNSDGIVLRTNRVVENWGLGTVKGVIGKHAHAVVHPGCQDAHCEVALGLKAALPRLADGDPPEFEFYAPLGDQTLQFTLRPMRVGDDDGVDPGAVGPLPKDTRSVLVVTDVSALRRAQRALEEINVDLESRVQLRTRELHESRNNLALLSEQLIQAQEGERRRIALELHDSVGQSLSAIKYTLERAIIMVQRGNLGSPEPVLSMAVQRIHETADGIRAISMNLRPQILDSLGAASATSWFCRHFAETYPSLAVSAEISVDNSDIPDRIATHLYRCVQELLNNVAKHAQAASIWIVLNRIGGQLILEVRDDGKGIAHASDDHGGLQGSGLRNLRERAEMTGGRFSLTVPPTGGTEVRIAWALTHENTVAD